MDDFVANGIEFATTVPCKQLAGVVDEVECREEIYPIPSHKEDQGMGLCAGAFMGGKRPAIIMQSTAIDSRKMTVIVCKCDSGNIKLPVIRMDRVIIRDRVMTAISG